MLCNLFRAESVTACTDPGDLGGAVVRPQYSNSRVVSVSSEFRLRCTHQMTREGAAGFQGEPFSSSSAYTAIPVAAV
jgi:hypothetical protein